MECVWIVFAVIGFGIWILVTLFRRAEEERQRGERQRRAADRGAGPGRRPTTDLDRFLEEARRRKEGQTRPAAGVPRAQPAPPPRPAREVRPEAPRPPERRREFVPSVRRSASEQRPQVPMARPTVTPAAPVVLEIVAEEPAPAAAPAATAPPPAAPPGGVLARPAYKPPPALANLPALLKQPQTLAAVFALREIFGPPLCRRYSLPTNAVTPRS